MTLPYPDSPAVSENIATSISRIEQNIEYLDGQVTDTTIKHYYKSYSMTGTSGVVTVTGIGFTPTAITISAVDQTGYSMSWGVASPDLSMGCVYRDYASAVGGSNAKCAYLLQASGSSQSAVLSSYTSDGATFTWTKDESGGALSGNMVVIITFYK